MAIEQRCKRMVNRVQERSFIDLQVPSFASVNNCRIVIRSENFMEYYKEVTKLSTQCGSISTKPIGALGMGLPMLKWHTVLHYSQLLSFFLSSTQPRYMQVNTKSSSSNSIWRDYTLFIMFVCWQFLCSMHVSKACISLFFPSWILHIKWDFFKDSWDF